MNQKKVLLGLTGDEGQVDIEDYANYLADQQQAPSKKQVKEDNEIGSFGQILADKLKSTSDKE